MNKKKIIIIVISVIVGLALILIVADKISESTGRDVKAMLSRALKDSDSKLLDYDYLGREGGETPFGDYTEYCYFGARIKKPDGTKEYIIGQMTFITYSDGKEDGDVEIFESFEKKSDYKRALKEYK